MTVNAIKRMLNCWLPNTTKITEKIAKINKIKKINLPQSVNLVDLHLWEPCGLPSDFKGMLSCLQLIQIPLLNLAIFTLI